MFDHDPAARAAADLASRRFERFAEITAGTSDELLLAAVLQHGPKDHADHIIPLAINAWMRRDWDALGEFLNRAAERMAENEIPAESVEAFLAREAEELARQKGKG